MGNVDFGKYKLIAELGHGGMADVFLAVQAGPAGSGFRKLSVIKRLRANLADEPEFIAMLVDEARVAARLNHPNVVQTNEVGNVGSQYFLAMEYLDGQPLHRIQHRSVQKVKAGEPAPLSSAQQYFILMDALAGLHHAHDLLDYDGSPLGIVHRDMTPQNIFITYEGQVKVVDFGIAKAAGRSSETRQGVVKGKVRYMAPEQALGLPVSRRTDVFAVGIMMWEAAVGKRLWRDFDEMQVVRALVSGELPPMPREIDPSIPEEVDSIIRKALSLRAEDRYASAEDFRTDIEQYLVNSGQLVQLRRQLSPMLNNLFKDKRAEIRSIIEQQLATIDDGPNSGLAQMATDSASTSVMLTLPPPRPAATSSGEASPASLSGTGVASTLNRPAPAASRGIFVAAAAAAVVIAGVGMWKVWGGQPAYRDRPVVASADMVSLELSAQPSTARLSVDGRPFEPAPVALRVQRDEAPHRVRVEADGYEPKTETMSFTRDVRATFTLARSSHSDDAPADSASAAKPAPAAPRTGIGFPSFRPTAPAKPPEPKVDPTPATAPAGQPATTSTSARPVPTQQRALDKGDPWGTGGK